MSETSHKTCEMTGCRKPIFKGSTVPHDILLGVVCDDCYRSFTIPFMGHNHKEVIESIHRCDPHMASVVKDVKRIIPPDFHDKICIAGGFAAHMAGITTRYDDIDVYCHSYKDYMFLAKKFGGVSSEPMVPRRSDEKYPFKRTVVDVDGLTLDVISPLRGIRAKHLEAPSLVNTTQIFDHIDLNWSLAAINLADERLYVSSLAFSNNLYINRDRLSNTIDQLATRIYKYSDRLRRKINRGHERMAFLPKRIGQK